MIDAYGACSVLSFTRVCLVSIPEKWSHYKMNKSAMYFSRLLALRVKFFVGKRSTSIIWTWVEGSISFIAILCNDKSWWKFPGSAGRHTCGIRNSALEMRNLANHLNLESKLQWQEIQNPILSWIPLHGATLTSFPRSSPASNSTRWYNVRSVCRYFHFPICTRSILPGSPQHNRSVQSEKGSSLVLSPVFYSVY